MDSKTQPSKTWISSYGVDVFPDSFCIGSALDKVFKDINNIQWIAVLDSTGGDDAVSCWDVWICFPTLVQRIEIDMLMSGMTTQESMPGDSTDVFVEERGTVPADMVRRCIEGYPYVQHNIPMNWKEIAKNLSGTATLW